MQENFFDIILHTGTTILMTRSLKQPKEFKDAIVPSRFSVFLIPHIST
jgi:hypothetical protein